MTREPIHHFWLDISPAQTICFFAKQTRGYMQQFFQMVTVKLLDISALAFTGSYKLIAIFKSFLSKSV